MTAFRPAAAPTPRFTAADRSCPTRQSGARLYNERLVLSLVRAHGSLSRAEIARLTGLSGQTGSVIMNQLEADGLLTRGEPVRGRVGQPSVPMSLDPEGAFSIGLKYGRRNADLLLMDFGGTVRAALRETYPYPEPGQLKSFLRHGLDELLGRLTGAQAKRICGLGVATPFEMWGWAKELGLPRKAVEDWRAIDMKSAIEALSPWPVYLCNDGTAACGAELAFGSGERFSDFLYVFFATMIGGGVVLNGALYPGRAGYAGSLGSILVAGPDGGSQRLIRSASFYLLEDKIRADGRDPSVLWRSPSDWSGVGPQLEPWLEMATDGLSLALASAISVIDFEAVVIDGAFPADVRAQVVERTRRKFGALDTQGLAPVEIVEGSIGSDARALGAASLPLLASFSRDRELLFRESA